MKFHQFRCHITGTTSRPAPTRLARGAGAAGSTSQRFVVSASALLVARAARLSRGARGKAQEDRGYNLESLVNGKARNWIEIGIFENVFCNVSMF